MSVPDNTTDLPRLIGLSAKKRHGKDTLGALLIAHHGYQRIAFADALYAEVAARYGLSVEALQDPATKESPLEVVGGRSPRVVLQDTGMQRRAEDEEYWVRQVHAVVNDSTKPARRWVITDVRLPNEAAFVERHGILVRVERPDYPDSGDRHVSEMALDDWPFQYRIANREGEPEAMLSDLLAQVSQDALANPFLPGGSLG